MQYALLILVSVLVLGCQSTTVTSPNETTIIEPKEIPLRAYSVQSVLWQQLSAEYKALCHQAFNLAKMQLDEILADKGLQDKPLAIVTDVDETVLDNSPYNAKMIVGDYEYGSETWKAWGALEKATPVPGALDFFNYAASKGVKVYYISNRRDHQIPETMSNLKKLNFPFMETSHFLFKTKSSGKEERRQTVAKNNKIVMLLGDNLSDFSELFDKKPTEERNKIVENMKSEFGRKFIVLPNPMYGDWEMKGIYEGNYNWTPAQKDSIRKSKLITY